MLKIKKGAIIYPYGAASGCFTEDSELSQAVLEHLKSRFPESIEDTEVKKMSFPIDEKKKVTNKVNKQK
jgi:hypothetical protein